MIIIVWTILMIAWTIVMESISQNKSIKNFSKNFSTYLCIKLTRPCWIYVRVVTNFQYFSFNIDIFNHDYIRYDRDKKFEVNTLLTKNSLIPSKPNLNFENLPSVIYNLRKMKALMATNNSRIINYKTTFNKFQSAQHYILCLMQIFELKSITFKNNIDIIIEGNLLQKFTTLLRVDTIIKLLVISSFLSSPFLISITISNLKQCKSITLTVFLYIKISTPIKGLMVKLCLCVGLPYMFNWKMHTLKKGLSFNLSLFLYNNSNTSQQCKFKIMTSISIKFQFLIIFQMYYRYFPFFLYLDVSKYISVLTYNSLQ